MQALGMFFLTWIGSWARRMLTSLGFGVMTYAALSAAISTAISSFGTSYNSIPSEVLSILNLAGAGDAFGIIIGAMTAKQAQLIMNRIRLRP